MRTYLLFMKLLNLSAEVYRLYWAGGADFCAGQTRRAKPLTLSKVLPDDCKISRAIASTDAWSMFPSQQSDDFLQTTRCHLRQPQRERHQNLDSILGQAYSVCATEFGARRNRRSIVTPPCGVLSWLGIAAAHSETGQIGSAVVGSPFQPPDATLRLDNDESDGRGEPATNGGRQSSTLPLRGQYLLRHS